MRQRANQAVNIACSFSVTGFFRRGVSVDPPGARFFDIAVSTTNIMASATKTQIKVFIRDVKRPRL